MEMEWRRPFAGYSWADTMGALPEDAMKSVGKVGDWAKDGDSSEDSD